MVSNPFFGELYLWCDGDRHAMMCLPLPSRGLTSGAHVFRFSPEPQSMFFFFVFVFVFSPGGSVCASGQHASRPAAGRLGTSPLFFPGWVGLCSVLPCFLDSEDRWLSGPYTGRAFPCQIWPLGFGAQGVLHASFLPQEQLGCGVRPGSTPLLAGTRFSAQFHC